ncbi:MAG TPA: arginine deiminase family protein [Nitriliruptoraceae bacterium]|nr:arginine deiminase family protein [Nitriliruptoraceae bacterium]
METTRAFVRPPSPRLAEGLLTHLDRQPVDVDRARGQWRAYVDALAAAGWQVTEVESAPDCPDSVFIEDTVVLFGDAAVITRPGASQRRPETTAVARTLHDAGLRVLRIEAPGTLDGGDVMKVGTQVHVGIGGRTNAEGAAQLAAHVEPLGATVTTVPVTKVLHLKSAVTALPDGTVIGFEPLVDDPGAFPTFLAVPEESGAHVVVLDDTTVLMAADAPETAAMLRARGLDVVTVDIGEFIKLEGCVTCLSVRQRP